MFFSRIRLNSLIRYSVAFGPRCLRRSMLMLSGPVEKFGLLSWTAISTGVGVIINVSLRRFLIILSVSDTVLF
jgi:hypothetical protein